jgi:hypothetical protein
MRWTGPFSALRPAWPKPCWEAVIHGRNFGGECPGVEPADTDTAHSKAGNLVNG